MTRVPSPDTEAFYAFVMDQLEELENLQFNFAKTKAPAEINALKTEMLKIVGTLDKSSSRWAREDLREVYKEAYRASGARAAIPKNVSGRNLRHRKQAQEGFRRAGGDIRRWVDDHANEANVGKARALYRDQLKKAETAARRGDSEALKQAGSIQEKMRALPEFKDIPDEPTVFYRNRKGQVVSRRTARQYYDMAIQSAYARTNNFGVVEGSADTAHFIVSDGPDCGWFDHDDEMRMNGEVVTKQFAASAPIGHPYCQRTFTLADGPPGSRKLQKQLRALTGTAQRSMIKRLAQAGPIIDRGYDNFSLVMRAISLAKDSNLSRMLIRQIELDNPGTLPAFATRSLRVWENDWALKENEYLRRMGSYVGDTPGTDHSIYAVEHLNQSLGPQVLVKYGWVDELDISDELRLLLGYTPGQAARKGEVLSRMEDYADFVAHRRAGQMIQAERLLDNSLTAEAHQFSLAAMSRQFAAPRGFGSLKKIARSYESAVKVAQTQPEKLGVEIVRELAANLDVLPWWRAQYGPIKFGAGLTADGRRKLAGQLYQNMRAAHRYNHEELTWAKSIGLHLDDKLSLQDIYKALQPRVSYTGKMMYYTVALENGKLAPILRVHPPFAGLRHLGFEANLAKRFESGRRLTPSQYLEALRSDYEVGGVANVLYKLSQESLYTVSIFKDSPVHASLRLTGRHLEGWAINTRADEKWIGSVWRLYGRPAVAMDEERRNKVYLTLLDKGLDRKTALRVLHMAEIPNNYQDNIFGTPLDLARRTLRRRLREGLSQDSQEYLERTRRIIFLEAQEAERNTRNIVTELLQQAIRFEDRFWVPRFESLPALPWGVDPPTVRAMAKLYAWQGDLLEVSRAFGVRWSDALRVFHRAPDVFEGALDAFNLKMGIKPRVKYLLKDLYEHSILKKIAGIIPDDLPGVKASAEFWIQKAKATKEWLLLPARDKKIILEIELDILRKKAEAQVKHLQRRWEAYWKLRDQGKELPSYFSKFDDFVPDEDAFRDNFLNRLLDEASDEYPVNYHLQEEFEILNRTPPYLGAFRNDVDDFYKAWAKLFGKDLDEDLLPFIDIGDGPLLNYSRANWTPGVTVLTQDGTQNIIVHHSAARLWDDDFRVFMKASHKTGEFSQGEAKNLLWHEVGHWLSNEISDTLTHSAKKAQDVFTGTRHVSEDFENMWVNILRELDPSGLAKYSDENIKKSILQKGYRSYKEARTAGAFNSGEHRFMQEIGFVEQNAFEFLKNKGLLDRLASQVSIYGASSPREMIAELFSMYMTDSSPSPLSRIVGEALIDGFKRKNNL